MIFKHKFEMDHFVNFTKLDMNNWNDLFIY